MRKRVLAGFLALFALWFVAKALPWFDQGRPAVYATPTIQPYEPGLLVPVTIKGGQTACTDKIPWGPDARYVQFTLTGAKWPASPLTLVASGPGYRAVARQPAGTPGDALQTLPITPATKNMTNGTLCITNDGRHQVMVYGIAQGRGSGPSTTTVDGKPLPQELSITLLTHRSQSIGARLGTIASHIAAFRPLTGWMVWILGLLAVLGVPLAVGVALARAVAEDEAVAPGRDEDAQPSARA
ncbi:MAG: hypothetical protein ABW167_15725 [Baekduia sp.]